MFGSSVGGGFSSCIRWICHIPTAMVGFQALGLLNEGLEKGLADYPGGRDLLIGLQLLQYAGISNFAWNFVMFLGSLACAGLGLGTVGLIDVTFASLLAAGTAKVSSHLPESSFACTHGNQTAENPIHEGDFCRSLFQQKVVCIVVVVIYFICGLVNIAIGFGEYIDDVDWSAPLRIVDYIVLSYDAVRERVCGLELWSWRPTFHWASTIKHAIMGWEVVDSDDDDTVVDDDDLPKDTLLDDLERGGLAGEGSSRSKFND